MSATTAPIGVFDSGLGGLTVLQSLRSLLPGEDFIYFADQAFCPYGGRPETEIRDRAFAVTDALRAEGAKLVVVACNTATIAAVAALRAAVSMPFVGMEPAVKPASALTRTGVVGVLATPGSLAGDKFQHLVATHAQGVKVLTQPCRGWVESVEAGDLDGPVVRQQVRAAVQPLIDAGCDVLVLGCTHFPLLRAVIAELAGPTVTLLETGPAVARQTLRVLEQSGLRNPRDHGGRVSWRGTGDDAAFRAMRLRLGFDAEDGAVPLSR